MPNERLLRYQKISQDELQRMLQEHPSEIFWDDLFRRVRYEISGFTAPVLEALRAFEIAGKLRRDPTRGCWYPA